MKYIRYTLLAAVGICLIVVGMANHDVVTLRALPEVFATPLGVSPEIELPLFMAIFIGVGLGLLIGFLWEWVREHHVRSDVRAKNRELNTLQREIDGLKTEKHEGKDEIIALLDKAS